MVAPGALEVECVQDSPYVAVAGMRGIRLSDMSRHSEFSPVYPLPEDLQGHICMVPRKRNQLLLWVFRLLWIRNWPSLLEVSSKPHGGCGAEAHLPQDLVLGGVDILDVDREVLAVLELIELLFLKDVRVFDDGKAR